MGIINSSKFVDVTQIDCSGTFHVTLSLTAEPDISSNPTDIVLVLDRSGSMEGEPLASLKLGADTFIDIIDETTDGSHDGQIGGGSHIGIVSFSTEATQDTGLSTSVADLKEAVDDLQADGFTNHADGFTKAIQLFDPMSSNAKVIVMFTDGKTTVGAPPLPVAEAAKVMGIEIYVIGLVGDDGIDVGAITSWASQPTAEHVAITPDASELEELFAQLARDISSPGATNIDIDEVVNPQFAIVSVNPPTKGTAMMLNAREIRWQIQELGATEAETAVLEFLVRFVGQQSGLYPVNESITYTDHEGNLVYFQNPEVTVDCGTIVTPEPCPEPINLVVGGCGDSLVLDLGDTYLDSLGRIVQLDVTLKGVCPGKRVALAIVLTELDDKDEEHQRGMKVITVPAHYESSCQDVLVKCVRFVLPEDINEAGEPAGFQCADRRFRARVLANYIDSGFVCCDGGMTAL